MFLETSGVESLAAQETSSAELLSKKSNRSRISEVEGRNAKARKRNEKMGANGVQDSDNATGMETQGHKGVLSGRSRDWADRLASSAGPPIQSAACRYHCVSSSLRFLRWTLRPHRQGRSHGFVVAERKPRGSLSPKGTPPPWIDCTRQITPTNLRLRQRFKATARQRGGKKLRLR
ncbi:MAG: hypothetical protein D6753_15550 [Planctomycetota bacterium]|nr:MAG: hypothetical protein D6753_15550 [Planctomycetota bacterium]